MKNSVSQTPNNNSFDHDMSIHDIMGLKEKDHELKEMKIMAFCNNENHENKEKIT